MNSPTTPSPTSLAEDPPDIKALHEAFLARLRAILDKPISPRMLSELEATAQLARQFLTVSKNPFDKRPASFPGYGYGALQNVGMGEYIGDGGTGLVDTVGGAPVPMRAETYGATLIRELVAAMKDWKKPKLPELLDGIRHAKAIGLPELAAELEAEFRNLLGHAEHEHEPQTVSGTPVIAEEGAPT